MAGRAAPAGGGLCAFLRQIRIIVGLGILRRRERGKIGAEIADVLVVDLLDDRLHLFVLAGAGAEVNQLPLDKLVGLRRKRGNVLHLRNAVFAVTADA